MGKQLKMAQIIKSTIINSIDPDPVSIATDSVGKTIARTTFKRKGDDPVVETGSYLRTTQAGAHPVVEPTDEIVCSTYPDAATDAALRAFIQAAIGLSQIGFRPVRVRSLPSSFQSSLASAANAIL
jgi:phosphate transport system substrate-binding protein